MDPRRLRVGEVVLGLAGVALIAGLFLQWYSNPGLTGFEALGIADVILVAIALAAIAVPVVTAAQRVPAVPVALEALVTLAGLLASVIVLFRVLNLPGGATGRDVGLWVALAGALAIVGGALVGMRDERLSKPGRSTDLSGRPAPPEPLPDPIPAPRSE
jgi:hypothetical protein